MSETVGSCRRHGGQTAAGLAALGLLLASVSAQAANVRIMSKGLPYTSSFAGGYLDNPYSVSGDGCRVVYTSVATSIISGQSEGNGGSDVFLFDRCTVERFLISHLPGDPKKTGNGESFYPKISRDGKLVVFSSLATDLVGAPANDTNGGEDVFVYEVSSQAVSLVSGKDGDATTTGDQASGSFSDYVINEDGKFVAFSSDATDLSSSASDGNAARDVYLATVGGGPGSIVLVSHEDGDTSKPGDGASEKPSISGNGARIAFQSDALSLVKDPGADTPGPDVFYWLGTQVRLASHLAGSLTASGGATAPLISGSGRFVAFESDLKSEAFLGSGGDGNGKSDVFLFAETDGSIILVSHKGGTADVAADGSSRISSSSSGFALPALEDSGRFLAYTSSAPDLDLAATPVVRGGGDFDEQDVFLFNTVAGTSTLMSDSSSVPGQEANGASYGAVLSAGFLPPAVAYTSLATDLSPAQVDTNDPVGDVFLSTLTGATSLVSHAEGSNVTTVASFSNPDLLAISADGGFVAFTSEAPDVVSGDTNADTDVFSFRVASSANTLVTEGESLLITTGANNISSPSFEADYARSSVSANGDLVAFVSYATNLVPGQIDANGPGKTDVFLYRRSTDTVEALVSHAASGLGVGGNGASDQAVISRDGLWVAFRSGAMNLLAAGLDTNGGGDIFLYDVVNKTVSLVSHGTASPTATGDGISERPVISANGSFVAYASTSRNLVPGQIDVLPFDRDVFRYDRGSDQNELVSHRNGSLVEGALGESFEPAISPNGDWVAYTSTGTNLISGQGDAPGTNDVFVWRGTTAANALVSRNQVVQTQTSNGASGAPSVVESIATGSAWVTFRSDGNNIVGSQADTAPPTASIFLWHNNETWIVSRSPVAPFIEANGDSDRPLLSDDAAFIVYETRGIDLQLGVTDVNGSNKDVYVAQRSQVTALTSTANQLVSHQAGMPLSTANSNSEAPSINGKGDFVAYESRADNLVAGQTGSLGSRHVYLWQGTGNVSALMSHTLGDGTTPGNAGPSDTPMISASGSHVAFSSVSSDLIASDLNGYRDAFYAEAAFADLQITKTSSPVATPGAPFVYTIVAQNLGPENAPGSTVTDTFAFNFNNPPTLTATWTCVGAGGGVLSPSGSGNLNEIVDLPAGGSVTFTVTSTLNLAPASGNIVNTATIVGPVADPDVSNNTSTDTDALTPVAPLVLTLTDSPDPVLTGTALTYVATLTNSGPSIATNATLSVVLPAPPAVFQSSSPGSPTCTFGAGTLSCAFGDMGPGLSVAVTLSLTAPTGPGTIIALANADSDTSNPVSTTTTTEVILPGTATIDLATVTSKNGVNTLEWLTPPAASGYLATVIRFDTSGFPATETDGLPLPGGFIEPGADAKGTALHAAANNVYFYSLFVDQGGGNFSGPKQLRGRSFDNSGGPEAPVQWAFSMGVTSVTAPTVGTGAVLAVANDRGVYAIQRGTGATSGLWPATFWPLKLQGIAQNRSPVVNSPTAPGASRVTFVGAQDGRVYAIDADRGANTTPNPSPVWTSGLLGAAPTAVQAAPAGIFAVFGNPLPDDLILVGSRKAGTPNNFYGLQAENPGGGSPKWVFSGDGDPIGIVSGGATVDYASQRAWFGSRPFGAGDPTLWCIQFDTTSASTCPGWPKTFPSGFDQSPVLRGGRVYIGDNLSDVFCFDALSGAACGSTGGYDLVPDGPVKGFVFPDRLSGDLYASTTNKVWAWTDTGAAIGFKPGWPGAGLTAVPNPSIPLFVRLATGPPRLYVGSSNGRLYEIDTTNPAGPGIKSVLLGGGGAVIGAPSLDLANEMVIVGSDNGVIYGVKVPLP